MRAAGARRWKSLGDVVLARRFAADAYTGPPLGHNAAPAHYGSAYPGTGGEGGPPFARQGDGDQAPQQAGAGRQNYSVQGSQFGAGSVVPQGEAMNGFSYAGAASQQLGAGMHGEGAQGIQYGAGNLRQGGVGTQQNGAQHLGSGSGAQGSQQWTGNVRQPDSGYGFPYAGAGIQLNDAQHPGVGGIDALHGSQSGAGSVMSAGSGHGLPQFESGLRAVQGSGAVQFPNAGSFGSQLPQQGNRPQTAGAHSYNHGASGSHFRPLSDERQNEAAPRPQLQYGMQENGPDSFPSFNRTRAGQRGRSPSPPPYSQSGDSSTGSLDFPGGRQEVPGHSAPYSASINRPSDGQVPTWYGSHGSVGHGAFGAEGGQGNKLPVNTGKETQYFNQGIGKSSFSPDDGQGAPKSSSFSSYQRSADFGQAPVPLNVQPLPPNFSGSLQQNLRNSVFYAQNARPLDGGSNSPTISMSNQASESGEAQSSPASSGWRAPDAAQGPSVPAQTPDHSSFSATGSPGGAAQNLPGPFQRSSGSEIRPPSAVPRNGHSEPASQAVPSGGQGNLWQSSPPQSNRLHDEGIKSPIFPSRNQSSESQRTSSFSGSGQSEGGPPSKALGDDRQRSPSFGPVTPSSHAGSNPTSFTEVSPLLPSAGIMPGGLSTHARDRYLDNPVPSARPHESGRSAPPFIKDVVKGLSRGASTPPLSEQSVPPVPPLVLQGAPSAGLPRKVLARLSNAPRFALKSDITSYFEGCNLKEEDVEFLYDDNYRPRFIHIDFDSQDSFRNALKTMSAKGRFGGKFMKLEQDSPIELDAINHTVQSLRGHGLLMQNLGNDVVMEDVDKFFQGYGLGMNSVRILRSTWLPGWRQPNAERRAIVQFDSYLYASRALREKQGQFCGSRAVELRYLQ